MCKQEVKEFKPQHGLSNYLNIQAFVQEVHRTNQTMVMDLNGIRLEAHPRDIFGGLEKQYNQRVYARDSRKAVVASWPPGASIIDVLGGVQRIITGFLPGFRELYCFEYYGVDVYAGDNAVYLVICPYEMTEERAKEFRDKYDARGMEIRLPTLVVLDDEPPVAEPIREVGAGLPHRIEEIYYTNEDGEEDSILLE